MAKYRKKPVVVEAFQLTSMKMTDMDIPHWLPSSAEGCVLSDLYPDGKPRLQIPTLEGVMHADIGDWIIRGIKGEVYPCKPDIFKKTYERVE